MCERPTRPSIQAASLSRVRFWIGVQVQWHIGSGEEGQCGAREKPAAFLPRKGRPADERAGQMSDLVQELDAKALGFDCIAAAAAATAAKPKREG